MKIVTAFILCLACGLSASAAFAAGPTHPEYALYFDGDGLPIAPDGVIEPECADHTAPGRIGWTAISEECFKDRYVPRILDGIAARGKHSVLLFAHGGLNSLDDARARVDRLISVGDAPGTLLHDHYPVFINWQASFFSSYNDHLFRVRQGVRSPVVAPLTSPYIFVKDLVVGAVRSLPDTVELIYNRRDGVHKRPVCFEPPPVEYKLKKAPGCTERRPDIDVRWGEDKRTRGQRIGLALSGVPWMPIKPLTTGFMIDALGSESWKIMVRRTELMFNPEGVPVSEKHPVDLRSLTYFLQRLTARLESAPETQLDFVAHSAGTLILNKALREVPELPVNNIVYMAAADSEEDYEATLLGDGGKGSGYLELHPSTQVYHLVLEPMAEINDRDLGMFELVPRGSLLYWIDNFLAEPEYLRQRTAGRATNLIPRLAATPESLRSRIHLKIFDYGVGLPIPSTGASKDVLISWYGDCAKDHSMCQPQSHGDFSEMPFWEHWFWCPHGEASEDAARCARVDAGDALE